MWKQWSKAALLAFGLCLPLSVQADADAAGQNQVVKASGSVYRLWGGVPLPQSFIAQAFDQHMLNEINSKGYLQQRAANGQPFLFFKQGGKLYLYLGHGSGYLISEQGHIVTNEHVANIKTGDANIDRLGPAQIFLVRSLAPTLELMPAKTIVMDAAKDLAVVQVAGLQGVPLQLADGGFIEATLPVFSVGFPGASDDLTAERGFGDPVSFLRPTLAEGTLKRLFRSQSGSEVWEHHAPMSGGNSGGPLVNRCGQVVGTNFAGHREQQNSLLAVANPELTALLKSRQLPFFQAEGQCLDAAAASTAKQLQSLYWVVGALFLLALGGAVYLMRLKSQVKAGQNPPINSQLIRKIVGMQQGGQPARQQTDAARHAGSADSAVLAAAVAGVPDIVLRRGQTLVVGRGSQADVVLNHPQISSRHLKLSFDGSRIEAEDLGSLNGTFVNGGKIGCVSLRPGDLVRLTADEGIAAFRVQAGAVPPPAATRKAVSTATLQPLGAGLPAVVLHTGRPLTLGRSADNDVVINHPQVSGRHCRLTLTAEGKVLLEDLQSTNGTFVDAFDNRISHAELREGQTVYLATQDTAFKLNRL